MPANVKPPAKPVDIYYFKVAKIVNILGCKVIFMFVYLFALIICKQICSAFNLINQG